MLALNLRNAFEEASKVNFKSTSPRNIALRITGYELSGVDRLKHSAVGIDMATGKEVKISLRSLERPLASGYKRLEIADIANSKEIKTHVVAAKGDKGGVIIFDECRPSGENAFTSSWANTAIHNGSFPFEKVESGFTTIVMAAARYDARQPDKDLNNVVYARHAKTNEAQMFSCAQFKEMTSFMAHHLTCPEGEGQFRAEVIVRYVDKSGEDIEVAALLLSSLLEKQNDDTYKVLSGTESLTRILSYTGEGEEHKNYRYLAFKDLIGAMKANTSVPVTEFGVEIIPVIRRNFGKNSRADFFSLQPFKNNREETYFKNIRTKKGEAYYNRFHKPNATGESATKLWYPANIATICAMETKQTPTGESRVPLDYRFIKDVSTCDVFPSGYEMKYLPTENFALDSMLIERYSYDNSFVSAATESLQSDEVPVEPLSSVSDMDLPIDLMSDKDEIASFIGEDDMQRELERLISNG